MNSVTKYTYMYQSRNEFGLDNHCVGGWSIAFDRRFGVWKLSFLKNVMNMIYASLIFVYITYIDILGDINQGPYIIYLRIPVETSCGNGLHSLHC